MINLTRDFNPDGVVHMDTEKQFNSGNKEQDMVSLLDCAYDIMELWSPTDKEQYNQKLRKAWLARAKELGAVPSI